MQMPSIRINQVHAQIAIQKNEPPVQIKQRQADMHIDQKINEIIQIQTTPSRLHIDQTEAFADANLKHPLRFSSEFYGKMISSVYSYIAKKVGEGKQLAAIHTGQNAIANIARQTTTSPPPSSQIAYMPKGLDRVRFSYQPSTVHYDVPNGHIDIHVQKNDPIIQMAKWQSDVYLKQKNQIIFDVVGGHIDRGM
ncbi:hypothetical protein BALCAV_0211580 [Alkalihalobacillus alcalophilus ATCC 27647 = CGMCC 1.3604]|nr:hypothetical protein BALCAV_0211580 [Alkalihalobacillus alcalophilus ATCC 27647 = CGMCC 1.3604]